MRERDRSGSFFWPIILIGAGGIWLSANFGIIPNANFVVLGTLWPVFLIAAGLAVLAGNINRLASAVVGLLTVATAVVLLIFGPQWGLASSAELKTDHFSALIGEATSAQVTLNLSSYQTTVSPLPDTGELISADLSYLGQISFSSSGSVRKVVTLQHTANLNGFDWINGLAAHWSIGLSPKVPTDLNIQAGSGSAELDLSSLLLKSLTIDSGSGSTTLNLPAGAAGQPVPVSITGGSGALQMTVPPNASVAVNYSGGSGTLVVSLAGGQPAQVQVNGSGSGGVQLPLGWQQVSRGTGDQGTWETGGFGSAAQRFVLTVNSVGSGNVSVR